MPSFESLVESLPHPKFEPSLESDGRVAYERESYDRFVAPTLAEEKPLSSGETALVMVSAPAAVGKSTVASQIAHLTGAPLWDLSGEQVGVDSLSGTLVKAYGPSRANDVFTALEKGDLLVILDALDETRLLSGFGNFTAFLEDVSQYAESHADKPSLLLFTRKDTSEIIEVKLQDHGVPYAHYRLDYFSRDRALDFVDKGLAAEGREGEAYSNARDELFGLIYDFLRQGDDADPWDEPAIRSFLGYAPVLEAIVEYLNVGNPARLEPDIRAAREEIELGPGDQEGAWRFLLQIVDDILDREHKEKALPALRERLSTVAREAGWSDWTDLYRPAEQCKRVLADHFQEAQPTLPSSLPPTMRSDYEEAISESLSTHPFINKRNGFANVVFREYIYAKALADFSNFREQARQEMRSPSYLPTPLFGRFLIAFSGEEAQLPIIAPRDLGFLYESLSSQSEAEEDLRLAVWQDDERLTASIEAINPQYGEGVKIGLLPIDEPVWLWRTLSYADVSIPGRVKLGVSGESVKIGPDVFINAGEIDIRSSEVAVWTRQGEDVEMVCEDLTNPMSGPPELRLFGDGQLRVVCESARHPWVEHRVEAVRRTESAEEELTEAFRVLRRGLLHFRSEGYPEIARRREVLDNAIYGNSPRGRRLIEFLREKGIVYIDGSRYVLDRDSLGEHGIHWAEIERGELGEVRGLLEEFLDWE